MELQVAEIFRGVVKPVFSIGIILVLTGCFSKNVFERVDNWEKIEKNNCGSFKQRGYGDLEEGSKSFITGKVRTCYNNKVAKQANIKLINVWGDTVVNVDADNRGKFSTELPGIVFKGKIIVTSFDSEFTIENIYLSSFRNNSFDIKLPTVFMFLNHDANTKESKEGYKILEKRQKSLEKLK